MVFANTDNVSSTQLIAITCRYRNQDEGGKRANHPAFSFFLGKIAITADSMAQCNPVAVFKVRFVCTTSRMFVSLQTCGAVKDACGI